MRAVVAEGVAGGGVVTELAVPRGDGAVGGIAVVEAAESGVGGGFVEDGFKAVVSGGGVVVELSALAVGGLDLCEAVGGGYVMVTEGAEVVDEAVDSTE